jgi:hypothetical protein
VEVEQLFSSHTSLVNTTQIPIVLYKTKAQITVPSNNAYQLYSRYVVPNVDKARQVLSNVQPELNQGDTVKLQKPRSHLSWMLMRLVLFFKAFKLAPCCQQNWLPCWLTKYMFFHAYLNFLNSKNPGTMKTLSLTFAWSFPAPSDG